ALEAFAVVADLLADVVGPGIVHAHAFADARRDPQDALDGGAVALALFVDVGRGDAVFFGFDHGRQRPFDDVQPLVVALAHEGPQRLFGDDLGQHHVLVGSEARAADRGQTGGIGAEHVAAPGGEGVHDFVELFD